MPGYWNDTDKIGTIRIFLKLTVYQYAIFRRLKFQKTFLKKFLAAADIILSLKQMKKKRELVSISGMTSNMKEN